MAGEVILPADVACWGTDDFGSSAAAASAATASAAGDGSCFRGKNRDDAEQIDSERCPYKTNLAPLIGAYAGQQRIFEPTSSPFRAALVALTATVTAARCCAPSRWESVSTTLIVVALLLVLGFAAASFTLRGCPASRRKRVAALTLLGFVPLLAVEARRALGEPLPAGSEAEATLAAVALALPSFTAVGGLAWHAASASSTGLQRFVRAVSLAAATGCVALVALGWYGLPQHGMLRVAELAPLAAGDEGFVEQRAADDPFDLGRSCIGGSCFAYVRSGGAVRSIGPRFARDARVTLLAPDADHLVLSANGRPIAVAPVVLDDETLGSRPDAAFAARTSLPLSFLALAALGLGVAGLGLLYRRRVGRKLASVAAAQQAWLLDNGWLALESGAHHRSSLHNLAPGPVLLEQPPQSRPYRGAEQDDAPRAVVGTRQQLVGQLTDLRTSVDALLLGAIVPSSRRCSSRWPSPSSAERVSHLTQAPLGRFEAPKL